MSKFKDDVQRNYPDAKGIKRALKVRSNHAMRYLYLYRKATETKNKFLKKIRQRRQMRYGKKYGLELGSAKIGGGLALKHAFNITVNSRAVIGNNCTLFKGSTIGSIRSGKREGVPTIGDRVVICANAMVCGGITIGNDVLISAGAFVDFDVPSDSVVIGNPGVIVHKEKASKDYCN